MAAAWSADPSILLGIVVLCWIYGGGVAAAWRRAGVGRGLRRWRVACFVVGVLSLLLALVSPLDALSQALFSAHMAQHLVLVVVAAPLLAASNLELGLLWGLSPAWRRGLTRWWRRAPIPRGAWRSATTPAAVFVLHVGGMWAWHAPALYEAALGSDAIHALEHLTFIGTGLLFWSALFRVGRPGEMDYALGVLYAFAAFLLTGLLGALITFSGDPWYPTYLTRTSAWGLTPAEDQQLAGLIMWIPAGVVYSAAGIAVFGTWLTRSQQGDDAGPGERDETPDASPVAAGRR